MAKSQGFDRILFGPCDRPHLEFQSASYPLVNDGKLTQLWKITQFSLVNLPKTWTIFIHFPQQSVSFLELTIVKKKNWISDIFRESFRCCWPCHCPTASPRSPRKVGWIANQRLVEWLTYKVPQFLKWPLIRVNNG